MGQPSPSVKLGDAETFQSSVCVWYTPDMAFFPAPGAAQLSMLGVWGGVIPVVTTYHVTRLGDGAATAWTSEQLALAAQRLAGAWLRFSPSVASKLQHTSIKARDLSSAAGAVAEFAGGPGGSQNVEIEGPFYGPVVKWSTGFGGRSNGRTFLPGASITDVNDMGVLGDGRRATIKTQADLFLADLKEPPDPILVGSPLQLVIVSALPPLGLTQRRILPVVSASVSSRPGVQRRRRV